MHVLIVSEKMGFHGGIEKNVHDVASGLAARGHRVDLVHGGADGLEPEAYGQVFARCHPCAQMGAKNGKSFADIVAATSASVVFVHRARVRALRLHALRRQIRVVRMVHDHDLLCPRRHRYTFARHTICSKPPGIHCIFDLAFLARSDASSRLPVAWKSLREHFAELAANRQLPLILVASEYMRQQLLNADFAPQRVRVVPPVPNQAVLEPQPVPHSRRILFVGQLIRGKGVDLLLRAMRHLAPDIELDVIGDGNSREALAQQARALGLKDRVKLHGFLSHDSLVRFYRGAQVVAFPSRWPEPFGMVGLEAMKHARPVVAFDVGGVRQWLKPGQTGLLVPPGDHRAMSSALARIIEDHGLAQRLGSAARRSSSAQFDFRTYLDHVETVLGEGMSREKVIAQEGISA